MKILRQTFPLLLLLPLTSCADFWHDLRFSDSNPPDEVLIPVETAQKKILSQREIIELLTQKLIMAISRAGLDDMELSPASESDKIASAICDSLVRENIVRRGSANHLQVNLEAVPGEAVILETSSGKRLVRAVLPSETTGN